MREYTDTELRWEYEREYLVYSKPQFPDAFVSYDDFIRQYNAADIMSSACFTALSNWTGRMHSIDACYGAFSHRRDVTAIIIGIKAGNVPPPIILKAWGWRYHLMSGNTRLSIASTLMIPIDCKIIEVK